jgi:cyanuric acid amidohydrolase
MYVDVHRIAMSNPADTTGLQALIASGAVDPATIVASIGKTEGNGGANDFTRPLATLSFSTLLANELGTTPGAVQERIAFVWSGGCEGILSPHATIFTRVDSPETATAGGATAGDKRLAISVQRTRDFLPEEVGRLAEVRAVAEATARGLKELGLDDPADVHFVQVKGPLLTPAAISDAAARGQRVVTTDPNRSKAYARGATALGVALALGEVTHEAVTEQAIANDLDLYSTVASTSAGGELTGCEVVLLANSPLATSPYRIGHASMADAIDASAIGEALASAGLDPATLPGSASRIAAVFAKAEAPLGGNLRGWRTTMLSDADINYERHARAAVGGVIASVTGDPRIFVSGGTEHQGPPGAAPLAAIVTV